MYVPDSTSLNCSRSRLSSMFSIPHPPDMSLPKVTTKSFRYQGSHSAWRTRSSCKPSLSTRLQSRPGRRRQNRFREVRLFFDNHRYWARTRRGDQRDVRTVRRWKNRVHLHRQPQKSCLTVPLRLVGRRSAVDDTPGRHRWGRICQFLVVCWHSVL